MLKKFLRRSLRCIAGDYWNGWLYATRTTVGYRTPASSVSCAALADLQTVTASPHEEIRSQAWSQAADTWLFGAWVEGQLVATCWVQAGETYRRRGGLFGLAPDEAELAQIVTARAFRGRGIATELIHFAAYQMGARGFRKLYAKIWHDNWASVVAFQKAGWVIEKRFLSVRLHGAKRFLTFRVPARLTLGSPIL